MYSVTGHDLSLANHDGEEEYATNGTVWTLHSHTIFFKATTGERLAVLSSVHFAFRSILQICVYAPLCPGQQPYEEVDGRPVYAFARLTRRFSFWRRFTLERYHCDGTLETVWEIKSRYWFALRVHLDIWKPGVGRPVGSFDQPYLDRSLLHSSPSMFDAWMAGEVDVRLFAVTAVAMDMGLLASEDKASARPRHD